MSSLPDKLSYDEVGGEKVDYSEIVDSSTDRSAEEVNNVFANASMATRTLTRFYAKFDTDLSGDAALASSSSWDAVWKGNTTTEPTVDHSATGTYVITLPASVTDVRGNSHTVNFQASWAQASGSSFYYLQSDETNSNELTVYCFNNAGSLTDLVSGTFKVWAV